jgi:hypothetical protein
VTRRSSARRYLLSRHLRWFVTLTSSRPTSHSFPQKFAHSEITKTLLTYLAGYKDFTSPEQMKRVVNLLHRQAVRTKAEGLFFDVNFVIPRLVMELMIIVGTGFDIASYEDDISRSKLTPNGPAIQGFDRPRQICTAAVLQGFREGPVPCCRGDRRPCSPHIAQA